MMTEKRFKMGESDIQGEMIFVDTQTNKIYWQEYFDEIVDLVNEQQSTISQLKEENEKLRNKLELANARSGYYQRMLEKWCVKDE